MTTVEQPITKADIEAKLRRISGEVESTTDTAKHYGLTAGIAAAVVVIVIAYVLGRRRGKKKTTVVEVRRV